MVGGEWVFGQGRGEAVDEVAFERSGNAMYIFTLPLLD